MIKKLKSKLKDELPGIHAWSKMIVRPKNREKNELRLLNEWLSKDKLNSLREAAILIALFEKDGELYFPLIKRPEHEKNHPGQIALRGGSKEENENLEETALREANEEIGIDPKKVQIIGELTPIPIPISGYIVHTFVAFVDEEPEWKISKEEVAEFFVLKVSELTKADNKYSETWTLRKTEVDIPIFKVMNQKIWGATASVLSEFIELIK